MMKRLLVTAYIKNGRIIANDELYLDGIIYHQLCIDILGKDKYWNDFNIQEEQVSVSEEMKKIIKLHTDEQLESINPTSGLLFTSKNKNANVFLASVGMYDNRKRIREKIRKRFEELKFEIFGRVTKKIYTDMGKYKNANITREVILTPTVQWVVVGEEKKIKEILEKVKFIGKERNIGYGEVERWEIKEKDAKGLRYFPSKHFAPFEIKELKRVHPPYHTDKNKLLCSKRYF